MPESGFSRSAAFEECGLSTGDVCAGIPVSLPSALCYKLFSKRENKQLPSKKHILVVDDEPAFRTMLTEFLDGIGCAADTAADGKEALKMGVEEPYDLVILDLSLPGLDGTQVLAGIKRAHPDTQVVMVTGYASVDTATEAMKLGAYDYIAKPFNMDEVRMIVERALERGRLIDENNFLRGELRQQFGFDNIIGRNPEIQRAYVLAAQVAQTNATVLILGETGTGKEFLARSIHYQSKRSRGPFVKVNCGALPETLLESELFGHEKGSFTGAIARRTGRFEMADGGSIFLDEIGDISLAVQLKLLRVLQEKRFERVGGSETLQIDSRIIAATNRDLAKAMQDGTFREDLFYRLNVITISLPPLRQRKEDIVVLAEHFTGKYSAEMGRPIKGLAEDALRALMDYDWPGNIRELENCIERAVILTNSDRICAGDLYFFSHDSASPIPVLPNRGCEATLCSLREVEKEHISRVLEACDWHQSRTADVLRIDRKTLRNKIREYGLEGKQKF